MKRYKIEYYRGNRSAPEYIAEISESGRHIGIGVSFFEDGKKMWQDNWKNSRINGLDKKWFKGTKNVFFQNYKKFEQQGIRIKFKPCSF